MSTFKKYKGAIDLASFLMLAPPHLLSVQGCGAHLFNSGHDQDRHPRHRRQLGRALGTPPTDLWSVAGLPAGALEEVTLTVRLKSAADFVGVCLDGAHLIGGPEWRPNVKPRAILELFVQFNLQYISIESFSSFFCIDNTADFKIWSSHLWGMHLS